MSIKHRDLTFDWICNSIEDTTCEQPRINHVADSGDLLRHILLQYISYKYFRQLGYTNDDQLTRIDEQYLDVTANRNLCIDEDYAEIIKLIDDIRMHCSSNSDPFATVSIETFNKIYEFLSNGTAPVDLSPHMPRMDLPFILIALRANSEVLNKYYGPSLSSSNVYSLDIKHVLETVPEYSPWQGRHTNNTKLKVIGVLSSTDAPLEYIGPNEKYHTPFKLLDGYDWTDKKMSLEDFVAFVANFAIPLPIDYYHMSSSSSSQQVYSDSDLFRVFACICRNVVSGESHLNTGIPASIANAAINAWMDYCSTMMADDVNGLVSTVSGNDLLVEILQLVNIDSKLVGYCTRPIDKVAASEALAYTTCSYKHLIADRFVAGMEAVDDDEADNNEDDTEDEGTDTTDESMGDDMGGNDDLGSDDDGGTDMGTGDSNEVDTTVNPEDDAEENQKPAIDPNMALFELAAPDSTMKDWMYRTIVARKLSALIKNPPENTRPSDLVLLKRWRSRWLYIVSIPCLRDVLSRISLRLS